MIDGVSRVKLHSVVLGIVHMDGINRSNEVLTAKDEAGLRKTERLDRLGCAAIEVAVLSGKSLLFRLGMGFAAVKTAMGTMVLSRAKIKGSPVIFLLQNCLLDAT